MAGYRRRLEQDLDRWIAAGLVPAASREPILDDAGAGRRLDAATALTVIGGLLAGVAVIAFVAANWSAIPRIGRFGIILAAFLAAAVGAAWAAGRDRPVAKDLLLSIAALVFGAAIGLTGQIFDITGSAQAALRGAGLSAALLALAGRSAWPAAIGLVFLGFGDLERNPGPFGEESWSVGWLWIASAAGAGLALWWRSAALAHAAGAGLALGVFTLFPTLLQPQSVYLVSAAILAGAAFGVRPLRERREPAAGILYGWLTLGALAAFGAAGIAREWNGLVHSLVWMSLSIGAVALGRHDRHAAVTGAGVVNLLLAGAMLLFNLGVGLMTSAAVFAACAVGALAAALLLRRAGRL